MASHISYTKIFIYVCITERLKNKSSRVVHVRKLGLLNVVNKPSCIQPEAAHPCASGKLTAAVAPQTTVETSSTAGISVHYLSQQWYFQGILCMELIVM